MHYNKEIGNFGEEMAVKFLIKKGYEIIGRNIQMGQNELDIVAKFKGLLVFVEVKTSTSKDLLAEDNMNRNKLKHFKRAVADYLSLKKLSSDYIRPDLISIDLDMRTRMAKVQHFEDIF
ncbi:YraN family protein [Candidatus Parcubacteria bacterium]|nr:YraN family protein [Patescibacteria group bacterium]MBU4309730.1 YraN family protein [Patescibacteria group bacterium]MBU4432116.1 YraN family protein [Patescibacteria group bacterium]MBU4577882.1 YraN family protein [Patescibacteria group bacterium]MCG2696607.1 YraN family protein [Candidatus Parcubacteria bacterium]